MHRYVCGAYGYIDLSPFRFPRGYSVSALNWFSLNFLTLFCVCYIQVLFILAAVLLGVLVFLFGAERALAIESQSLPSAQGDGFLRFSGVGCCLVMLHEVSADSQCGEFTI